MYKWQVPYQQALLELDPEKLRVKLEAAETAIFLRAQEMAGSSDHHAERLAMKDALKAMRVLQAEKLNFPEIPNEFQESQ